ncbi:MAG: hypothetical protein AAFU73_09655 [Planctomycetota bacterium]
MLVHTLRRAMRASLALLALLPVLTSSGFGQNVAIVLKGTVSMRTGALDSPTLAPLVAGDPIEMVYCVDGQGSSSSPDAFLYTVVAERTEIRTPFGNLGAEVVAPQLPCTASILPSHHTLSGQVGFMESVNGFATVVDFGAQFLPSAQILDLVGQTLDAGVVSGARSISLSNPTGTIRATIETVEFTECGLIQNNYCSGTPNSTGGVGGLTGVGSNDVATNDLTLVASDLPIASLGIFLASRAQGFTPNPGGSAGNLCLGGAIGRYGQIVQVAADGTMTSTVDLTQTPQPTGLVAVAAGETWRFQAWHRDGGTSNFTVGLEIPFD